MKTNVTLKRHSIQGVDVLQRTSDGYFNITELTKAFNAYFGTNKRVQDFFDNQQTKDFIAEIYNQEVLSLEPSEGSTLNPSLNHANESVLNPSLNHANESDLNSTTIPSNERDLNSTTIPSKERDLDKDASKYSVKSSRGHSGGTWVHPMLFLKYMMYLSPSFEYRALKMVQDNLIQLRNETGDARKTLANAITKWAYANGAKTQEQITKIIMIVHKHLKDHFGDKDEGDLDVQKRWCKCTDRLCGMFEDSVMFGNKLTEDNIRLVISKF